MASLPPSENVAFVVVVEPDSVAVTAVRPAQTVDKTPTPMATLIRNDIERQQARSTGNPLCGTALTTVFSTHPYRYDNSPVSKTEGANHVKRLHP